MTSMSLTPSFIPLVSKVSEVGSSQSGLRWNANWASSLEIAITLLLKRILRRKTRNLRLRD